jgi:DNA-binding SARP family transcriptional activator
MIEISLNNMPVDQFGYYTLVEPFVDGYYKVGETEKARNLFDKLKTVYQERLEYYAGTNLDEQYSNIDEIIADMEAYRRNIDNLINNNDREVAEKETLIFN